MASVQIEIQSFVDKFAHLSSLGYNNNLHFNSYNDVVFVNFQAELGVVNAEPRLLTCVLTRPVKPSKVRRSARRDESRINKNVRNEDDSPKDSTTLDNNVYSLESSSSMNAFQSQYNAANFDSSTNSQDISDASQVMDTTIHVVKSSEFKTDHCTTNTTMMADQSSAPVEISRKCCAHECYHSGPPPDNKCCYRRYRPSWTLAQREKNYGSRY